MTTRKAGPGRPCGDAIDDDAILIRLALLRTMRPQQSLRGALIQAVSGDTGKELERHIRRVTRKWEAREKQLMAQAGRIIADQKKAPRVPPSELKKQMPLPGSFAARFPGLMRDLQLRSLKAMGDHIGIAQLFLREPALAAASSGDAHPAVRLAISLNAIPGLARIIAASGDYEARTDFHGFREERKIHEAIDRKYGHLDLERRLRALRKPDRWSIPPMKRARPVWRAIPETRR